MQTFIPYGSDFEMNAFCLDAKRLGKQRVETLQILNAMDSGRGWSNHPATRMWTPYRSALVYYGIAICREWIDRGYNDGLLDRFLDMADGHLEWPYWIDDQEVLISHRSNLIRKKPEYYGPLWPDIPDNLPYIWPN